MSKLLDKIKGTKQAIAESRAAMTRAYKFKEGKTVISILPLHTDVSKPDDEKDFYVPFGQHYVKNKKGETIVVVGDRSLCFPGEECPVRDGLFDLMRKANEDGDTSMVEVVKESLAKESFLMNVIVHQDPDKKAEEAPQLVSLSKNLFDDLASVLEEYLAADMGQLMRWNDRLLLIVERTGKTKNDTRYKIIPAAAKKTIDPSIMSKAVNLPEYVNGQFNTSVTKALSWLSTALGRSLAGSSIAAALAPAPGTAPALNAPAAHATESVEDLLATAATPATNARAAAAPAMDKTMAVDAVFEEVPAAAASSATEDLLAEIDNLAA
jgi:hypothetical protein